MSIKDSLTNEPISKRFDNPFALVNYSISMALKMISKGDVGSSHLASDILEMIADNQDEIEMAALDYEEPEEEEEVRPKNGRKYEKNFVHGEK